MNGGTLEMPQTSWANLGYYGPGLVQVNGGVMRLGAWRRGIRRASVIRQRVGACHGQRRAA
jgi:hypothetical protein